jgi:hypothetical protein
MAESSVAKKLHVKSGQKVLVMNAPADLVGAFQPLPEGAELVLSSSAKPAGAGCLPAGRFDLVLLFAAGKEDVDKYALTAAAAAKPAGALWMCYPKGGAKAGTDINRDKGWDVLTAAGMGPVSMIAIDAKWSALRFKARK